MKLSHQILIAFSIVLLLSVADSLTNYMLSVKVEQNTEFLNKSESVIRNSARLHKEIIDMQSAFRGFLLTEDSNFLDRYDEGIKEVPVLFAAQNGLVKDNIQQALLLGTIGKLHSEWVAYANSLIEARKKMGNSAVSHLLYRQLFENKLKKQVGKKINDAISQHFTDFDKSEYAIRRGHSAKLIDSIQRTRVFSFVFLTLTIIVGLCSTIYIVTLISKRIKTMVQLAENISVGNFTRVSDTHSDELTSLSSSLNIMSENLSRNISELEKRNAELDKFAYVVSHDLKAPVRGIHNIVNWIEEDLHGEISPKMREYLDIIPQKTKRMEDLINGLLDYARLREKTAPEKTDTNALIREIVDEQVPRHFMVETHSLPVFYTEKLKLQQVFTNLLSNAVKYTKDDKGLIIISCRVLPGYYEFSVKDNGIGIDPEYHQKIFEIFQTLREKNEKESTGIGLAIIKKILDDKLCTIKVNSVKGRGSEFIFTWPLK
jgi:signal transduction histidine kinase